MVKKLFNSDDNTDVPAYVLLIITSAISAILAVKNIILSSDSITYGLVSQQILDGNGIRIPIIGILGFDSPVPVNGTVPFLVQPPLLPIFLSLLGGLSPQSYLASQALNVLCHVLVAIFTFSIMKIFSDRGPALLTAMLVTVSWPLLNITHRITSETLFSALIIASIFFLTLSRNSGHNAYRRNLLIASIFASAAILTRYAGIALLAVFLWEAFLQIKKRKRNAELGTAILAIAIPVLTIAMLFTRNYLELGTIRGIYLPTPERSYLDSFTGLMHMLFLQFHLGRLAGALSVIFMACFVSYILINAESRREALRIFNFGLDYLIIFTISYLTLIYVTLMKDQPYFEVRYVTPLVPFLFMISVVVIFAAWKRIKFQGHPRLSLVGLILSLSLLSTATCYKTYLYMPEFYYKQDKSRSFVNSCLYELIVRHYGNDTVITTNEPYQLSFFGGYSTVIMPNRKWVPNVVIPSNMEELLPEKMLESGSRVLVLFHDVKKEHFGTYVAYLFSSRKSDNNFYKAYECSDGVVYNLKD